MDETRLQQIRQLAKLREQDEKRRSKKIAEDLRLQQQESQAQDEARRTEKQHYAQLPGPSYTGIR